MTQQTISPASAQPRTGTARTRATLVASGCLALLAACLAGGARAEELQPIQGRSIALGPVDGIAYYTNDETGSHLVATLNGGGDDATPIRVVATLVAGQNLTLSVPRGVGEPAIEVTFSRRGERVFVSDGTPLVTAEK